MFSSISRSASITQQSVRRHMSADFAPRAGKKASWYLSLMQKCSQSSLFTEPRKFEYYPPFFLMRAKCNEISDTWRKVTFTLPLTKISTNPGGVLFGGFQASLSDPIPALACARLFPGYSCATRSQTLSFEKGGNTDLTLRFIFCPDLEESIRNDLKTKGRSTPTFEYGYYLKDGTLCTKISNSVAIRPYGYTGKKVEEEKMEEEWRGRDVWDDLIYENGRIEQAFKII